MGFGPFDHIFKRYWGVAFYGEFTELLVAHLHIAHINDSGQELVFCGVHDGIGVNGDQQFLSFAVYSNAVVIILVLVRGETYENILGNPTGYRPLFRILNFEKIRHGRQYVQSLRMTGHIDQPHFKRVRLEQLVARELDHFGLDREDAVAAYFLIVVWG